MEGPSTLVVVVYRHPDLRDYPEGRMESLTWWRSALDRDVAVSDLVQIHLPFVPVGEPALQQRLALVADVLALDGVDRLLE